MEYTRAKSFRVNTALGKSSESPIKKSLIRNVYNKPILLRQKIAKSSSPDPSLTVKMMRIYNRPNRNSPINSRIDDFGQQAHDTLNSLIKNGAITFLSPHELINQMSSESPSPAIIKSSPRALSLCKVKKHSDTFANNAFSDIGFRELRLNSAYIFSKKIKENKIEITGSQIPKIHRRNHKYGRSEEIVAAITTKQSFNIQELKNIVNRAI
ncbi:hypothetical protein SteCoe_22563 [Stentor coeruleus]|uniref:Uncharacterized protein n=1 Tax=Stentor coeruleus TaxID=5963 RepID=A0A1R2BLY9_9CILI|nr:hypothetical protein SteCoe_22563 [Stentor coeruleus]